MTDSRANKPADEPPSGEVVNGFCSCRDLSDIVPLYTARSIYLKPHAKINVSINLPQLKTPGKTISTWEVQEKLRLLIRPDIFASLKVIKSSLEFIRFEADLGDRSRLQQVLARLDGQRLNLAGFPNVLKVKAAEAKDDFPSRHSWDSYFRDAKHMNELKPGERPDTIHISGLPVKWFSEDDGKTPSEPLIAKIFKRWGNLRRVDVPAADPYRSRMRLGTTIQKFSYEDGIFFDAFVQYNEYMDFVKAMDALRGMKLFKKNKDKQLVASIKVDFDKTKHMSDNSVSHREFERKRLIAQDNMAAEKLRKKEEAEARKKEEMKKKEEISTKEKEARRRRREEKRKRKALTVFRKQEEDKVSMKIAREERKLIKAQRQLESIRLLDALFEKIRIKVEKNEIDLKIKNDSDKKDEKSEGKTADASAENTSEVKNKTKKEKIKKKKKERKKKKTSDVASDESVDENKKQNSSGKSKNDNSSKDVFTKLPPQAWYYNSPMPILYPPMRGFPRGGRRGRSRGNWRSGSSTFQHYDPHELNEQYYKYFANLVGQDYRNFLGTDSDKSSSRSRSRSRRRSKERLGGKFRGRSRSRSGSRSKTRRKRSRSRSRSRSRKGKWSDTRRKSKSRSRSRSKSRTRRRSRSRRRSLSKSTTRNGNKRRARSKSSRSSRNKRESSKPRSKSQTRVTRARSRSNLRKLRKRGSRSSSWSLPKSQERRSCSWSRNVDKPGSASTSAKIKHDDKASEPAESHTPKEKRTETATTVVKPG